MSRVIIAGSRPPKEWSGKDKIEKWYERVEPWAFERLDLIYPLDMSLEICGMADGFDEIGRRWAEDKGFRPKEMPAQWVVDGKSDKGAGHKRNKEMAVYAAAKPNPCLIAFHDGISPGTESMIRYAKEAGFSSRLIYVVSVRGMFGYR